ncbi:hypothetical protein MAUB_18970 [Mycolicibacterium aubagnense]|uniref:TetR family transcriptional regulator n=1 Tax=Mycolicibacterium aubagnense TaxID=319707 RepID=A0ABM7IBK7_9MYCO|nr:hypothetical protein MAUB_18970 [Mycolicibacterium aubagnense]
MNSAVNYRELEHTHILCTARELIDHAGWQELLADELRCAATQLRQATAQSTRPTERIRAYTATMIDHVYPVERCGRFAVFASISLNRSGRHVDQIDALVDELIEPLREAIHVGCQTGEMSSQRPDDDAQSIFHLVTGMILTQATLGRRSSPESLKGMVMDAVAHALGFTEP